MIFSIILAQQTLWNPFFSSFKSIKSPSCLTSFMAETLKTCAESFPTQLLCSQNFLEFPPANASVWVWGRTDSKFKHRLAPNVPNTGKTSSRVTAEASCPTIYFATAYRSNMVAVKSNKLGWFFCKLFGMINGVITGVAPPSRSNGRDTSIWREREEEQPVRRGQRPGRTLTLTLTTINSVITDVGPIADYIFS